MKARTYDLALPRTSLILSLLLACAGCARSTTRVEDFADLDDLEDPSTGSVDADAGSDDLEGPGEGDGDLGDGDDPSDPPGGDGDLAKLPDAGLPDAPDAALPQLADAGPPGGDGDGEAEDPACASASSCVQPVSLGALSGDTDGMARTTQGTTSGFFSVKVTEDDHGAFSPKDLKIQADLVSTGPDFDLFLYGDGNGCSVLSAESRTDADEHVETSWTDDQGLFGSDSGRMVYLEVRHKAGMCGADSPWTLTIKGN